MRVSQLRVLGYLLVFVVLLTCVIDRTYLGWLIFLVLVFLPFAALGFTLFLVFRFRRRSEAFTATPAATGPLGPDLLAKPDGVPSRKVRVPRVPNPVFVGVLVVVIGAGTYLGSRHWYFMPVNTPIPLQAGTKKSVNFRLLAEGKYAVRILIDRTVTNDPKCSIAPDWSNPSILKGNWTLYREGDLYDAGTFENERLFDRSFYGAPAQYRVEAEILSDASCLQNLHPRLVVEADEYWDGQLSELLGWSSLICFASGVVIVLLSVVDWRRHKKVTVEVGGEEHVGPVIYRPGVRRPLREKFIGLPHFGTIAAFTMFLILVPVWIGFSWRTTPKGLLVGISSNEYLKASSNRSVGPLMISVERCGKSVCYRIDGNKVAAEGLYDALKKELSRRADWVVFVEGDPDLPYQDIVHVIDVAHELHARSVLFTPGMRVP